jgi:amino acid transporter
MLSVWEYLGAKLLGMPRLTFALAQQHELPSLFCAVNPRFHTPWFSIGFYSVVIWILAIIGGFAWNVTLSVIARLFYYGVICAAVIALRHRQTEAAEFRLPGGALFPVLGIGVCIFLATQVDFSQFRIVAATATAAILHWAWIKHRFHADGQRTW